MALSYPPQLTGEYDRDILALHRYLYDVVDNFVNASGEAIDPTVSGQGGGAALVITEAPTAIVLTSSTSLSVDATLFGQILVAFTLPDRAVSALVYYKEASDTAYHVSSATVSPYSIANLKVGVEYQIQVAGMAANGAIGPLSFVYSILIDSSTAMMKAPADAQYLVSALDGLLTAERLVTDTATIAWDFTLLDTAMASIPDLAITTAKLANLAVTTGKIAADAVTYAKMQNISAASRLLGRGSSGGAGDVEELTVGTGLAIAGTVVTATGVPVSDGDKGDIVVSSTGTVWTVDTDAITTAKILDANVTANKLASDAVTTVKILNDNVTYAKIQDVTALSLLGRGASSGDPQEIVFDASILATLLLLLKAGTYTPTATIVANCDAVTAFSTVYIRIGPVVAMAGRIDVDPTAAAVVTRVGLSLPVASNFANLGDCAGCCVASNVVSECAAVVADVTNDRAELRWVTTSAAAHSMYFVALYSVI